MNSRLSTVLAIFVLAVGSAFMLKAFFPFDGLEFNGDSYRYYLSGLNFATAIREFKMPPEAFWPYGFPSLIGTLFQFLPPSFSNAQLIPIGLTAGIFILLFLMASSNSKFESTERIAFLFSLLLLLFSGLVLKYQVMIMSDIPALFWATLTIFFLLKFEYRRSLIFLLLIAVSATAAILSRYVYGLILVPVMVAFWISRNSLREFLTNTTLLIGCIFILSIPQLIINAGNLGSSINHPWLTNWNPIYFWIFDRTTSDGHLQVQYPNFIFYLLSPFRLSEFTPLGFLIFGTGVFFSMRTKPTLLTKIMMMWFLVFYFFLAGIPIQNQRFTLCLYVPIFYFHYQFIEGVIRTKYKTFASLLLFGLIMFKMVSSISFLKRTIDDKNEMYSRSLRFLDHIPPHSLIITWDFYEAYLIYSPQQPVEHLLKLKIENAVKLVEQYDHVFIISDEKRMQQQWGGLEITQTYDWLREKYNLTKAEESGKYTVWKLVRLNVPELVSKP